LLETPDREDYLRAHSGLPGPRANLELLDIASELSEPAQLERWAGLDPVAAPENTPAVFLVAVGMAGLGRLVGRGDRSRLPTLRQAASDPRWRVREAVAIGLQYWGDLDPDSMVDEMARWTDGSPLVGRAAVAAVCEPRLLRSPEMITRTLAILDRLTQTVRDAPKPIAADVRVLRQTLGYAWSVAIAADPSQGILAFERWRAEPDPDVQWIVTNNLGKARLARVAPEWVGAARQG
jgi:hypothetical protein